MKKLIAILLSAVLLFTSVLSASMFTVSADEATSQNTLDDTVVLPVFVNEKGNEINLPHTTEYIPNSVSDGAEVSLTPNTTSLPMQTLFKFKASSVDQHTVIKVEGSKGKGMMMYVEMPESLNGNPVRLAMQFRITDGQSGAVEQGRFQWGYADWYYLSEGSSEWKSSYISNYGMALEGGFKGYVYVPFNTIDFGSTDIPSTPENENLEAENPSLTNWGIDSEDIVTGVEFQTANGSCLEGSMSADSEITVSAPIIVKGAFDDSALPNTRTIVSKGEQSYLFESYEPYTGSAAHTVLRIPVGAKSDSSPDGLGMTKIESPTPLISTAYKFSNISATSSRAFISEVELGTSTYDTQQSQGVVFYVETTLTNPEFHIHICVDQGHPETSWGYGTLYYLRDGDTAWQATGDYNSGTGSNYRRKIISQDGFSGYIYQPYGGDASTYPAITAALYKYSDIAVYSGDGTWVDKNGNEATLKISQPMVVTSFNENSSNVTVDGGALVNPFSGESVVEVDINDYYKADEFIGNKELIKNGANEDIMSIVLGSKPERVAVGVEHLYGIGSFYSDSGNGFDLTLEENNTVFKEPLLRIKSTDTAQRTNQNIASVFFSDMYTSEYSGYLLYIRNDSETDLNFALQPYPKRLDGSTIDWTQIAGDSIPFLTQRDGIWQWSSVDKTTRDMDIHSYYTYRLPAGEGGFLYLTKDLMWNGERYNELVIRTADNSYTDTYWTSDCNFVVSTPLFVKNYSDKNAGMAFVNGGDVAQDLLSGDFTCPNDYDGNIAVNILDLVLAKEEANDNTFDVFRRNYLANYFDATEYSVLSASFSVAPLVYNPSDASTFLSTNSDRGYRTEMLLYIKEGTPDPLYYDVYYVGDEPDGDRVNSMSFESEAAAQAWIDTQVANESTVNLVYYNDTDRNPSTGTMSPKDTYIIDCKTYTQGPNGGKTLYYVYRAFDTAEKAYAFCYGEKILKGDNGYTVSPITVNGTTYYKVIYDYRAVFTGLSEQEQIEIYNRTYDTYFKTDDSGNPIDPSSITLTYLYLTDWNGATADNNNGITEPLSDAALRSIEIYFETMRTHSVKSEVRFSYNGNIVRSDESSSLLQPNNKKWLAENCANEVTILKHIEQLAPVVQEYKSDIFNISCGFIGFAGEMVDIYQYPDVNYATVQKAVVENLCAPNNLYFSTRLPEYKEMIREEYPDWEYFGYVATNNDASFGETTKDNWGSEGFQKGNPNGTATDWWEYVTANAAYTPQGGEMFVQGNLISSSRVPSGLEMILQLAHHRYSTFSYWHGYLEGLNDTGNIMKAWMNESITPEILEANGILYDPAWFKGNESRNAYEFIRDHLGYRIAAKNVKVDYDVTKSDKVSVQVDLNNYGFAAAFNMESSLAIFDVYGNMVQEIKVGDPSTWYNLTPDYYTVNRNSSAQGNVLTHTVSAEFNALKNGTYYVGLKLNNTAGTSAHLANSVELNGNGYNVLGSFRV